MRKAVLKRIRITKNGKMLRRATGQNHFNAKAPRKAQLKQHGLTGLPKPVQKMFKRYLTQK